jgi:hypothetical protein
MAGNATPSDGLPDDLANWRKDLKTLWLRVLIVANKSVALACTVILHKGLDALAEWLIPSNWVRSLTLLRGTFASTFMVIYLHFLWEMLTVFVPSLHISLKRKPEVSRHEDSTKVV